MSRDLTLKPAVEGSSSEMTLLREGGELASKLPGTYWAYWVYAPLRSNWATSAWHMSTQSTPLKGLQQKPALSSGPIWSDASGVNSAESSV
eukprot:CAMPEP_0183598092 /NCGR_PEP_ID=MMETSP0371-20130417/178047_1 /TAXON_ID=268820 /ORGANISM="Peridinium aciculiferum, Strain PAER-2" /LENGTH=90 /DNA_ID=CAMNT_0025810107 /DNA_START=93 /DNA_END=365 /DNA_ORIENTATION=+